MPSDRTAGANVVRVTAVVLAAAVFTLAGVGVWFAVRAGSPKPTEQVAAPTTEAAPPLWSSSLPVAERVPDRTPPSLASRPSVATPPSAKPSPPEPPAVPKEPVPVKTDSRGFVVHTLTKRIDTRSADELEKELLSAREVALEGEGGVVATKLKQIAVHQQAVRQPYPGAVVAAVNRPELAGLPFRLGPDAVQSSDRAQAMSALSGQLRGAVQGCIQPGSDPRPDTNKLFAALVGDGSKGLFKKEAKAWATAEAVPCIQQMLLAENREVRRMSCELLRGLDVPEALEALVRCAVFDTDAGNRAAAVDALRNRPKAEVTGQLLKYVRYPWPRATEHAAEALVAIGCIDAVPALAVAYTLPDPDAPFTVRLPGKESGQYRRELVRVNHLRNCMLCHPPSLAETDLIRGGVPDPDKSLGGPATSGYDRGGMFITAATTYLRQDFSQVQPVANPAKWPGHQRFDYFVGVTAVKESSVPTGDGGYKAAVRFALRELTGRDPDKTDDLTWLRRQPGLKLDALTSDGRAEVAALVGVQKNPLALVALRNQDFAQPLLAQTPDDLRKCVLALVKAFGAADARLALIAYLDPLTRSGSTAHREKAARFLAVALDSSDAELASGLKTAASTSDTTAAKPDGPVLTTAYRATIVADPQQPVVLGSAKFFVAAAVTSEDVRDKWVKDGDLRVLTTDTEVEVVRRDGEFCEVKFDGKLWHAEGKYVPADRR